MGDRHPVRPSKGLSARLVESSSDVTNASVLRQFGDGVKEDWMGGGCERIIQSLGQTAKRAADPGKPPNDLRHRSTRIECGGKSNGTGRSRSDRRPRPLPRD